MLTPLQAPPNCNYCKSDCNCCFIRRRLIIIHERSLSDIVSWARFWADNRANEHKLSLRTKAPKAAMRNPTKYLANIFLFVVSRMQRLFSITQTVFFLHWLSRFCAVADTRSDSLHGFGKRRLSKYLVPCFRLMKRLVLPGYRQIGVAIN